MIDFKRYLAIVDNCSRWLEYTFGIPFDLGQVKGLDLYVEKREELEGLMNSTVLSKDQIEREIFTRLKDYIRANSEVFQKIVEEDGVKRKMWFSPYFNRLVFDELEELGLVATFADEAPEDLKEIFYKHKKLFNLNDKEGLFIDLCFAGYNPSNEVDVLVFKEALETDSNLYVKTFFNRLCDKLKETSMEIGLR